MMKNIKVVIIDDEIHAAEYLVEVVQHIPGLELIGYYTNPFTVLEILQNDPDILVFLDVNMNEISGINFTKLISNKVIFTTAFKEFAVDSYDYENTVDYLLKPIYKDRLLKAVSKVRKIRMKETVMPDQDFLTLKSKDQHLIIDYGSVNYIRSSGHSTLIYSEEAKEPIITIFSLKKIEEMLPPGMFIRIHKQYLVNQIKIAYPYRDKIMLFGGTWLPLGSSYIENFLEAMRLNGKNIEISK